MTSPSAHRRTLPHRLRLLCLSPYEPPWALLSLRLDSAGCDEVEFRWHTEPADALAHLRRENFDCLFVFEPQAPKAPETTGTSSSALLFVEGLRTSGSDDAVVAILVEPNDEAFMRFDEYDCEVLVSPHGWQSRGIVPMVCRALSRGQVTRDVVSLEQTVRSHRVRERDEAQALLQQQRAVIDRAAAITHTPAALIPERAHTFYRDLLRTFVMMATGSLDGDVRRLAEILALADIPPRDVLDMHLTEVQRLIDGLGSRSSRHVLARADILALELMTHLGASFRSKAPTSGVGDRGVDLLHADSLLQKRA